MKTTTYILGLAILAFATSSCDRRDDNTPDSTMVVQENESAEYAVEVDAIADEAYDAAQANALKSATVTANYITDCAILTLNLAETTKVLTIDFGTGCVGKDGKTRTGKIIITTESFTETNFQRTFSFDNYTVNGHAIAGNITKTITNNIDANSRLADISEDITITLADNNGTLTRAAELVRLYEFGTLGLVGDNKFTTWGETVFTNAQGNTMTKNVAEATPLIYKTACRQVVSGIMEITFGTNNVWSVNFGDDTCDNLATASNGENSWVIRLRK